MSVTISRAGACAESTLFSRVRERAFDQGQWGRRGSAL